MKKITYLFGAGASRHALPIVDEIPDRVKKLIELLESDDLKLDDNSTYDNLKLQNPKTKREHQMDLIESLKWMMTESKNHASVDTFAKKLFIKQRYRDLDKLRVAMSVFFIFEQILNKSDPRYDTFFASLIDNGMNFPDNVRILSWNYDYQFELVFSEYTGQPDIISNQKSLKVNVKYGSNDKYQGFQLYKLNGTCGLQERNRREYMYVSELNVPLNVNTVGGVTRSFAAVTYSKELRSSLSFAWEGESDEESVVRRAMEDTSDTTCLVVIGYSFPFFNREVDRKIIGNMKNLKRVYIQAPDADILKERFQAFKDDLTNIELLSKFDVKQFLLPNEL